MPETHLRNAFFDISVQAGGITGLRIDPAGKSRPLKTEFARALTPDGWETTPATKVTVQSGKTAEVGPLTIWRSQEAASTGRADRTTPDRLLPGETLAQSFTVAKGMRLEGVALHLPTWHSKISGATLRLYRGETLLAERRLVNIPDNDWAQIHPPSAVVVTSETSGVFRVTLSDPTGGDIGWWRIGDGTLRGGGNAERNGQKVEGIRAVRLSLRRPEGSGRLRFELDGPTLSAEAFVISRSANPVAWTWRTGWTKDGYDCTAKSGTVFRRFYTDTLRYLPAEQLKRRGTGGLSFENCHQITMDGAEGIPARLRLESGSGIGLRWEMSDREMAMRFSVAATSEPPRSLAGAHGPIQAVLWRLRVLPQVANTAAPEAFPHFAFPDPRLTEDSDRFLWERAFSYPSPALPAAWFEWMALERAWVGGSVRDSEMRQLESYPITPEGYVHTWRQDPGWPLRPTPTTDTRHADTNARFLLACWRYWLWTGDDTFLHRQADRIRRAMRYQLKTLHGADGLIVTISKDVQGRHGDQSDNYWDILPFGHLDAYDNAVFYASLQAMADMEKKLGGPPLADWKALRETAHRRYDETFWDGTKGRYIGCVDSDGNRHDYGFTFVNLEALYYGLGDTAKARRIYHWLETEPTSSGKPDTYTRFRFAPRATTIHNPTWGDTATPTERADPNPPWWVSWWKGRPWEEQCQDGGAILYLSYFDLMARQRYLGADNAWKRWSEILERYRLPDRLCGGSPLITGEKNQQEDAGQVGVDYPFPESGLVPCYLVYGVLGIDATAQGLQITPHLPASLPWAEVRHIVWRGKTLTIRASRKDITIIGLESKAKRYSLPASGSLLLLTEQSR